MKNLDINTLRVSKNFTEEEFMYHFELAMLELESVSLHRCLIELPYVIRLKRGRQLGIFSILRRTEGALTFYSFGFFRFFDVKTGNLCTNSESNWDHQRSVNFIKTLNSDTYEPMTLSVKEHRFASFKSDALDCDISVLAKTGAEVYDDMSNRLSLFDITNLNLSTSPLLFGVSIFSPLQKPKLTL